MTAKRRSLIDALPRSVVILLSSLVAIVIALLICGVILLVTGKDPIAAYRTILETGATGTKLLEMLKRSTPLILSACAVAIGFKMNLFNIGVEGQYLFAALIAAESATHISAPPVVHVVVVLLIACAAGAFWASIAALLKITRGINEVISTIMLNFISLSVMQWLFDNYMRDDSDGGLRVTTTEIAPSGRIPDIVDGRLNGMWLIALFVVFCYWLLVFRSKFGFRLRSSGLNSTAAQTAGIAANRMIIVSMLLSGAVAGLVAMQSVLGEEYAYGPQATPTQFGFAGIAVALLGRNNPVGIVIAAMLFGFTDSTSAVLQLSGIPNSIVKVIQAVVVITVVIVNEATSRYMNRRTAELTAAALRSGKVAV
jgi:simple sugar transport system permease protein